jgi:hypothetical protein
LPSETLLIAPVNVVYQSEPIQATAELSLQATGFTSAILTPPNQNPANSTAIKENKSVFFMFL